MAAHIYTRTGDDGTTGLFGGERVQKDDLRVQAYGTVDELNAHLGIARGLAQQEELRVALTSLQNDLFALGADLATPGQADETRGRSTVTRVSAEQVARLEAEIDRLEADLPPLTRFILPGGAPDAAQLHLARTVCRRAERCAVTLSRADAVNPMALAFLNRLSDLLFVMARYANFLSGTPDVKWNV